MFRDNVNLDARYVHSLHRMYHGPRNQFRRNQWYSYMMWVKRKLTSVHLKVVLILTQDRCTVCAECTIGSESFWMHLIVLLADVDQEEAHFNTFGDSFNLGAR
jgi:hypothetical protein